MMMMDAYLDPRHPAGFGGARKLARETGLSLKKVKEYLKDKAAYTMHKPINSRFRRRKTFVKGIGDMAQADLADMSNIMGYNDNYRFLLIVIDAFSRFAYVTPLKNKSAKSVTDAFAALLAKQRFNFIQSDKGREFLNNNLQQLFRNAGIKHYTSQNDDIKCSIAERFIRTLKEKIWRYLTHKGTFRYLDVLQDLVTSYNNTYHSTIKMRPSEVTVHNEAELHRRLYSSAKPPLRYKFDISDTVRISHTKRQFKKGYENNWSEEIFTVSERYPTDPPTYGLKEHNGETIEGKFYEQELQHVIKKDDVYAIENILKTRKRDGKTEYYVKWKNYPEKYNSWVSDIITNNNE